MYDPFRGSDDIRIWKISHVRKMTALDKPAPSDYGRYLWTARNYFPVKIPFYQRENFYRGNIKKPQ